ncbi:unnamed protein product [Discosporangium mesarthrocarpum]
MHIAAQKGYIEVMSLLIEHGVDINIVNKKNGKKPLHYAVEALQVDTAMFILEESKGVQGQDMDSVLRARLEA